MTERSTLELAIAALETQRETLGSAVVDASIAAIRDNLAAMSSTRPAEQRKLVTVLFVDIVNWTAISEQLDPEDLRQIQHRYFDAVTPVITGYGGAVEKYIGDAVLAVFGVPVAHEDDAKRAVLAGLAIQETAESLNAQLKPTARGQQILLRVGIHTGLVMATTGSDSHDFLVTGDTVNLAARLQTLAEPGTVLVSQETHRLVADEFLSESLPVTAVKGVAEPISVYRIAGVRTDAPRLWTYGGLSAPLVGRQAELAVLQDSIRELERGQGAVAVVIGNAGVGKSRLVAEAFKASDTENVQRLRGRCLSYGSSIPYHLWLDVLRSAAQIPPDAPQELAAGQLRAWVERNYPDDFSDLYDVLARLLSLSTGAIGAPPDTSPTESQYAKALVFNAFKTLFKNHSTRQSLAIICDDLQWADPSSIELLEQMAMLTEQTPLLLICIFRPQVAQAIWNLVGRLSAAYQQNHRSLWLQPLSATHSEQLVANLLGSEFRAAGSASLDGSSQANRLLWRILSRAEGNPYFLEEAIRSLIQSGALTTDGTSGQWRLRTDLEDLAIPKTVQAVLGARIDSLPAQPRRVLQVAAVIGRDFSPRVLATILAEESALDAHLNVLLEQEFIAEVSGVAGVEYRFTHVLVQEVAYKRLLRSERRTYHRRVAETLEALAQPEANDVETLALHWQRAGNLLLATAYYVQSGDRARLLGSSEEAAGFFETALRLAGGGEGALIAPSLIHERLGDVFLENLSYQDDAMGHYLAFMDAAVTNLDRARASRKIASISMLRGDLAEARKYFEAALTNLTNLPSEPELNRVRCGLAYLFLSQGNLEQAAEHVRRCTWLARRIGDTRGLADAYRLRGAIADMQGRPRLARSYARRCLRLYDQLHDLPQLIQAYNNFAVGCRQLGQYRRAGRNLQKGLDIALRLGDIRDQSLLLLSLAELLLDQGRPDEAVEKLQDALPLAQSSGTIARVILSHRILGQAYRQIGRLEDAHRHLDMALCMCRETGHYRFYLALLLDMAGLAVEKGDDDEYLQLIRRVRERAGSAIPAPVARELLRLRGQSALAHKDWNCAIEALEASLVAVEDEPLLNTALVRWLLALAYAGRHGQDDSERARQQLRMAEVAFRRAGAKNRLAEIGKLRHDLAEQRALQSHYS